MLYGIIGTLIRFSHPKLLYNLNYTCDLNLLFIFNSSSFSSMIALAFFCSFAKGDEALAKAKKAGKLFILPNKKISNFNQLQHQQVQLT